LHGAIIEKEIDFSVVELRKISVKNRFDNSIFNQPINVPKHLK